MPIVVQHGQTGDFSTLLRLQEAQNQQNQASNAYIMNAYNQNAYEKRAETAAKQKAEALAAQGLAPDKSALERLVGMDKQKKQQLSAEYETNRESRAQEEYEWDDELRRRLKARQDVEDQRDFRNKIMLSNYQAQQREQLQQARASQDAEMQFQKARDKGDITLIPSVQKTMSDLQNRLASINNSPRLTPRQKQEQSAIIKQQLGGIQNNQDNYTPNQQKPMNIDDLKEKGFLKELPSGSYVSHNTKTGKTEIIKDSGAQDEADRKLKIIELELKEKEIEFNSGLKFSKQEVNMQKRISSLEQQIKNANSDLARATSGNSYTDENKAFVKKRQADLAALSAELINAYSEYSNSRTAVDQPTQQGQPMPSNPAPQQAPPPVQQQPSQQVPISNAQNQIKPVSKLSAQAPGIVQRLERSGNIVEEALDGFGQRTYTVTRPSTGERRYYNSVGALIGESNGDGSTQPPQAQAGKQAQIPPEMQAAINWIKTHPSEQDRPKREAAIQKLKALGITGI
jgi:hypothetical protein